MSYDPFVRGEHPVGVKTLPLHDEARDRRVVTEVYYPAASEHAGRDVDRDTCDRFEVIAGMRGGFQLAVRDASPISGRHRLVLFSHGFAATRQQSSFLCTHLASHGYVVASPDHAGNTISDAMQAVMSSVATGQLPKLFESIMDIIDNRPRDMVFVADQLVDDHGVGEVDTNSIGIAGHSFGGWTSLTTTALDKRIDAVLPLAPAGGTSSIPGNPVTDKVQLDWGRQVPSLFIVAERDSLLSLEGMHDLFGKTAQPREMIILLNADHMHFCDRPREIHEMFRSIPQVHGVMQLASPVPPFNELCPAEHALDAIRGAGLAHFDAHLRRNEDAAELLRNNLMSSLSRRGIDVDRVT